MAKLATRIQTKRKKAKGKVNIPNLSFWGSEYIFDEGHELTDVEISKAFTWYNYNVNEKEAKAWLVEYLDTINHKDIKTIKKVDPRHINSPAAWTARIKTMGWALPEVTMVRFEERVQKMVKRQIEVDAEAKAAEKPAVQKSKPTKKPNMLIQKIEECIDNKDWSVNIYEWLIPMKITKADMSDAINHKWFAGYLAELEEAIAGKNAEIREAYENFSKSDLKEEYNWLKSALEDVDRAFNNSGKSRKPRKKKVVPVAKKIMWLKYKKESIADKLVSQNPESIIGACNVWLFDVKRKVLTVLRSDNQLDVKGTTIIGFNPEISEGKKVRANAESIVGDVLKATKPQLRKMHDQLTTKAFKPNGRTNDDVIILRIEK